MAAKSRVQQRAEMGERLALPVAAQLARTQLVLQPSNGQHAGDTLNRVAEALAHVAPLQITDSRTGETRTLSAAELQGAAARDGAALLVLNDGRSLAGVSIRRVDLRQAIAILKVVGLKDAAHVPAAAAPAPTRNGVDLLRARFAEIEKMLEEPLLTVQVERAKAGAVWIARHAAEGRIANLAMQLMSALHETHGIDEVPGGFRLALARLRAALEDPVA